MPDLATLKARIARDLRRTDLTTDIGFAVGDAVAQYQGKRFAFNQVRDTFDTVAGTEFYSARSADATYATEPNAIPNDIAELDAVTLTSAGSRWKLDEWSFDRMERLAVSTASYGEPIAYAWYRQQLRLYPTPGAVYTLTLSYLQRIAVPVADGTNNAWTTAAEALIRASAKRRLYRDVLKAPGNAAAAAEAEAVELRRLVREAQQLSTGGLTAT